MNKYLSLVKFSHTVFALPFALIGFFLGTAASGEGLSWNLLGLILLCMVFARSAAMGFNRYIDRYIDAANPRTAVREIPSGMITPSSALVFVIINCIAFIGTTWFINPICFYLSPVALMVVLGYSWTKRFTALCHLVLGLGLSLAPIGAYLAVTGKFAFLPILFSLAVITWVSGFDVIYALQDEDFDRSKGLNSLPVRLGTTKALQLSSFLHALSVLFILFAGFLGSFHWFYWPGCLFFAAMLVYQHSLVRPGDLSRVNLAFFTANGIASVVFGIIVVLALVMGE